MKYTVADRVKRLRSELGLTQQKLGKLAGVSKNAVSWWENSKSTPERDALMALQKNAKVNPDWLIKGAGPMFQDVNRPATPINVPFYPVPPVRQLPVFSWEAAGRPDKGMGEGIMDVSTKKQLGPNSFVLVVENDALGEAYLPGGVVIVDPDAEPVPGKAVVAIPEGVEVPVLRILTVDAGQRWLTAKDGARYPTRAVHQIIGPVISYQRDE